MKISLSDAPILRVAATPNCIAAVPSRAAVYRFDLVIAQNYASLLTYLKKLKVIWNLDYHVYFDLSAQYLLDF